MKAYKGFNKDMTCRGFRYEEGKTYTEDKAELCEAGFHACEYPLDCFRYYPPTGEFREVEIEPTGERGADDTKVVSKTITIGAKLDISGMVKAAVGFVFKRSEKANSATGYRSANSATGYRSANSATGDWSANSATGYGSANSATGDWSANSATGDGSANSATGYWSANSATGDWSANSATGARSANSATGYGSANSTTGDESCNEGADGTINVGWGYKNRCKGKKGAYIVLAERSEWDGEKYPLINARMAVIDGEKLKEDVWYMLVNGEFVEVVECEVGNE